DALADKEAEAHPGEPAVVYVRRAVETVEYLGQVVRRNADALVADVDEGLAVLLRDADPHLALFWAVFHRVLDQILENLSNPARVVVADNGRISGDGDSAALIAVTVSDIPSELDEIDRLAFADELALLESRGV